MVEQAAPVVDLRGRTVVVTGGSGGIGLGIARGVARAGGSVAVWARRADRNAAAVRELSDIGAEAAGFTCDVGEEEDVVRCMELTVERFGRVDALVANAGVRGRRRPFAETVVSDWRDVLRVNLDGAFFCLREATRRLVTQGDGGALVAVSSTAAVHGAPGHQAYAVSKSAVLALIRSLAVELGRHGIRANSLLPGWTETELTEEARRHHRFLENTTQRTPAGRWATPADFEQVGAYLCDPTVTYHTGDSVVVDGGYTVF